MAEKKDQKSRPKSRYEVIAAARKSSGRTEEKGSFIGVFLRCVFLLVFVGIVGVLCFGGYWAYKNREYLKDYFDPPTEPLRSFDISSSIGRINEAWFKRNFDEIKEGISMGKIDIDSIKERLLSLGQIKEVFVSKEYPDKLSVQIVERIPILWVKIQSQLYVVDEDGVVFKPVNYDQKGLAEIAKMPEISDANVIREKSGDRVSYRFAGMDVVNQLLIIAQEEYPELYKEWRSIDIKKFDGRDHAPYASIRVKTPHIDEIIFAPKKFSEQMAMLFLVIKTEEQRNIKDFEYIDLSFVPENGNVIVKAKKLN